MNPIIRQIALETAKDVLGETELQTLLEQIPLIANNLKKEEYAMVWRDKNNTIFFLKVKSENITITPNKQNPFKIGDIMNITEIAKEFNIIL